MSTTSSDPARLVRCAVCHGWYTPDDVHERSHQTVMGHRPRPELAPRPTSSQSFPGSSVPVAGDAAAADHDAVDGGEAPTT